MKILLAYRLRILLAYRLRHERHIVSVEEMNAFVRALKDDVAIFKTVGDDIPSNLLSTLKSHKVSPRILEENLWQDFFHAATNYDVDGHASQSRLIEKILSMQSSAMNVADLLLLYAISLKFGLFNIGYAFRKKAKEVALIKLRSRKKLDLWTRLRGIAALMEDGKYDEISYHLSASNPIPKKYVHGINFFYLLFTGVDLSWNSDFFPNTIADEEFKFFLAAKSVAIVGPLKNNCLNSDEINNHDLVVRFKHMVGNIEKIKEDKNIRCDITYFNGSAASYFPTQGYLDWPEWIKWVVCKEFEGASSVEARLSNYFGFSDKSIVNLTKVRSLFDVSALLFYGSLNAIPNTVIDLLRFTTVSPKIFHSDLYLTIYHASGYFLGNTIGRERKGVLLESVALHDPVTQYCVMNRLYRAGRIFGDKRFLEVMSFGEKGYMNQMQKIYGDAGRVISASCG